MEDVLGALSDALAAAVAGAGKAVVAVNGRQRFGSSGVVWRSGVIVTAEHTLRRDEEITVTLPDGASRPATLAGRDPGTDLAVLKADTGEIPPLAASSGEARQTGRLVLAVGRAVEAGPTAALGIISSVGGAWRTWRGGLLDQYLRLDLSVYPGLSGAAVIETEARLVGIATSALSRAGAIAIPAATIERVAAELLATGRVRRGYFGVGLQPVAIPERLRVAAGLKNAFGLMLVTVEPGGPADQAGAMIGDILVGLNGNAISDLDDVQAALTSEAIGKTVEAAVIRAGAVTRLGIQVGERGRAEA